MFSIMLQLTLLSIFTIDSCLSWHDHRQNKEDTSDTTDIHTIPLGSEATFHWRYIFEKVLTYKKKSKNKKEISKVSCVR